MDFIRLKHENVIWTLKVMLDLNWPCQIEVQSSSATTATHVTIFIFSDAFPSVWPPHNRKRLGASKMQHFPESKRGVILKRIQMCLSLQTYPDASHICAAFGCIQNATVSSVATLSDTETHSDASCCTRLNSFENLQKFFKQQRLHSLS